MLAMFHRELGVVGGVHYWYGNSLNVDCDIFFPSFLMHNKGKLAGFGKANVGKYEYTQRTEYLPLSALSVSLMK